jgi:putative transposase
VRRWPEGFPQAIETVYLKTTVQLCIARLVRASLNYLNWKKRKQVAQHLKSIYRAATEAEAKRQLKDFSENGMGSMRQSGRCGGATGRA